MGVTCSSWSSVFAEYGETSDTIVTDFIRTEHVNEISELKIVDVNDPTDLERILLGGFRLGVWDLTSSSSSNLSMTPNNKSLRISSIVLPQFTQPPRKLKKDEPFEAMWVTELGWHYSYAKYEDGKCKTGSMFYGHGARLQEFVEGKYSGGGNYYEAWF